MIQKAKTQKTLFKNFQKFHFLNFLKKNTRDNPINIKEIIDLKSTDLRQDKGKILIPTKQLGKAINNKYLIFESNENKFTILITKAVIIGLSAFFIQAIWFSPAGPVFRYLICSGILSFLLYAGLSNRFKLRKQIKMIELDPDLTTVYIKLMSDKTLTLRNKQLSFNTQSYRRSGDADDLDAISVYIKNKKFLISFKDCFISDNRLLSYVLRGYSLCKI